MDAPNPLDYQGLVDPAIESAAQSASAAFDPLEQSTGAKADTALKQYQGDVSAMAPPPMQTPFSEPEVQDHFKQTQAVMPFLFAMSALGGKLTKASGMSMLGGMTGMQKGLIQGDQEAYQKNRQKYEDAYRKWREDWESKRDTYEMYLKAYAPRIDASKIAWEKAEKVHDDVSMAKAKAYGDAKTWAKISNGFTDAHTRATNADTNKMFKEKEIPIQQQNADAHSEDADTRRDKPVKVDAAKEAKKKKVVGSVIDQIDAMDKAIDEQAGITGLSGMVRRGVETAKTATGIGDQNTPAHKFATANNLFLSELPIALGLSSRSAKDQREKVEAAADALRMGATGPIAKQQLKIVRDILTDEMAAEPAAAAPSGADKIRADYKAGSITKEQALQKLKALGMN